MSDDEGFKRRSTRTAAIEAAKRIKNNAHANKLLSHGVKQEYQFDEAKIFKPFTSATINNGASHINTQRKCRKSKISDQALDSTVSPSKVQMHDSSTKMTKIVATNSSKHKDMPKRGRGRPPKAQSAKCPFTSNTSIKFEDTYDFNSDVNVRRESYNASLLKNELTRPKLQPGYGGITYMESLMKFCKDLGPTARKIALRKLLGQGLNYQARHRLEPLLPSSEARSYPCVVDVNSTNSSLRNAILNQVTQPLINFEALKTDATADYKGKRIMIDDGTSNFNKWDDCDNLELLSSKQKTTINIGNNYQENINSVSGGYPYGSSENQDFVRKNFGYSQVGNWRPINQIGSLRTNNNGNLPQNINNINRIEDVEGFPRNGNLNLCVHPTTYVQPSRKIASSSLVMNDAVSWVPPPLAPQNWYLPPPETKNSVVNDGFRRDHEFPFASTSCIQMTDQQPKVWIENSWAQNQLSQQQLQNMQHQQHQIRSYQNLFNHNDSQPQDKLLMPMQTQLWSHTTMFGVVPKKDSFPFRI